MAYPSEIGWHNMVEKSFEELLPGKCRGFLFVAVLAVAPAKGHMGVGHFQDSGVRYGHAVHLLTRGCRGGDVNDCFVN